MQDLCQPLFAQRGKSLAQSTPDSAGTTRDQAIDDLMHVRENIAKKVRTRGRQIRPHVSGACSFRDFLGSELRQIDHLVKGGETGRAVQYAAEGTFV